MDPEGWFYRGRARGRINLIHLLTLIVVYNSLGVQQGHGAGAPRKRDIHLNNIGGLDLKNGLGLGNDLDFDLKLKASMSSHKRHDARLITAADADSLRMLSPANAHRKTLYKRDTSTSPAGSLTLPEDMQHLHELAKVDKEFALLEYIERVQSSKEKCTRTHTLQQFNISLQHTSFDKFKAQTLSVIRYANVLNSLFRGQNVPKIMYNEDFYYYYLRALLESDPSLFGATIAFDAEQFDGKAFSPNVYRNKPDGSRITTKDLAQSTNGAYATENSPGYDWFWKQRNTNFSSLLWPHHSLCTSTGPNDLSTSKTNVSNVVTTAKEGMWSAPYYSCSHGTSWMVTYSAPFFGCREWTDEKDGKTKRGLHFKGVVALDIELERVDINQCATDNSLFANTHRCRQPSTRCDHEAGMGFRRGSYRCVCADGYYFHRNVTAANAYLLFFNGSELERSYYYYLLNQSDVYNRSFTCLPCAKGCAKGCIDDRPCLVSYDVMMRGIPLGLQSFCITISVVLGIVIIRLRKSKVMKASMWCLLEILLIGAILLYSTVVIQYFEPTTSTCLLLPWFRELGFAVVYGTLILKVYRVLAEFQSRKAHRVHVRDKDLLKYLLGLVLVVIGYMSAWTAINMDHVRDGEDMLDTGHTSDNLEYIICKSFWWDYVIEVGEFMFLVFGIYLCYCIRSAPSDYSETRYISYAIYNETILSALLHVARHIIWLTIHPDYIFLMYFLRCQLTVTVTLLLVLGPKLWYAHRPPEDDPFRNRAYSQSDVHDTVVPESMKLQVSDVNVGISSNGDVDVGEINLSDMDPEDIRAELKRLYTQLQIYKTKTMRKDNPHISKRRGGRKQTHRRFSLQAFHHKHRHHHSSSHAEREDSHVEPEMSKTPEESTNSAEAVNIQMDCSSTVSTGAAEERTPTVTFKPGHKSFT